MIDILLKSFVTLLVFVFVFKISIKIIHFFLEDKENKEIFLFIHVKNQENNIEYIIRTTIFNYLHQYGGRLVPYIVIVDKGSEDKTFEIAKKLCDDYDFVYYTTSDEFENFKKQIKQ